MSFSYKPPIVIPSEFLSTINYNGMSGRLLHLPPQTKGAHKIVMLSGQHAAHERMYAIAELLNEKNEIYFPDLPGFGGMDSFYKVGKKPSYDNYADYLYSFLKTNRLIDEVSFFTSSFGAQVMTRMFQRHPDSVEWTRHAVAFVGFAGGTNFKSTKMHRYFLTPFVGVYDNRLLNFLIKVVVFNPFSIKLMLQIFSRFKAKMQSDDDNLSKEMIKMEGYLWTVNDHQTHARTAKMMFNQHLYDSKYPKINLTLLNLVTEKDQYFDNDKVKQDFEKIYQGYKTSPLHLGVHTPSMIADKEAVRKIIEPSVLDLLA